MEGFRAAHTRTVLIWEYPYPFGTNISQAYHAHNPPQEFYSYTRLQQMQLRSFYCMYCMKNTQQMFNVIDDMTDIRHQKGAITQRKMYKLRKMCKFPFYS